MKKLVMVDVLSSFRIRYVVEVEDDIEDALDEVVMREDDITFEEFSQKHLEPTAIIEHREISQEEYIKIFDEDNDYLKTWTNDEKKKFINVIDYKEHEEIDDGA
jgi:succinate dehydrogenase flavin-adding protein (antitoxin of CptAB toxin-antitoxin module)